MKTLLFAFLIFSAGISSAAISTEVTGNISGSIIDANGEGIPGVVVMIEGYQMGGTTDFNGLYTIGDVKPGSYSLICRLVSYQQKKITDVSVEPGKNTVVNVTMDEEPINIGQEEQVVIVAARKTNSEASVLLEMKEAKSVMSGIGSQQIAKSQDASASEVARRIPGVTVIDNRFVMVRGVTERYNAVLLNNALAPSFETDAKSFSFDVVPSFLIDRLLIYKSPSPDLPGDFAGGAIRVFTKNFPDYKTQLNVDFGMSVRQGTTFQPFRTNSSSSTDWLGYDDGSRELPSSFPANVRDLTDAQDLQDAGRSLPNSWAFQEKDASPDMGANVSFGKQFRFKNLLIGNMTAITYQKSSSYFVSNRLDYNLFNAETNSSDTIFAYNDDVFQKQNRVGAMFNWGVKAGKHSFGFQNFLSQHGLQENTFRNGINKEEGNYRKEYSYRYNQRTIYTGQLNATHDLFSDKGRAEWSLGYSFTDRSDPDWKRIRYTRPLDESTNTYQAYVPFSAQPFYLGRLYMDMHEETPMFAASYEHKLGRISASQDKEKQITVKAGTYIENKQRQFAVRNIGYAAASFQTFGNTDLFETEVHQIFSEENINTTNGLEIDEDTKGSDSYKAGNKLTAAYLMTSIPIGNLTISGGARVEKNIQSLHTETLTGEKLDLEKETTTVLPSMNASYQLSEKTQIRGGYGKTLNRPEFREIAPYSFYDFVFNSIYSGNESLKTATIDNYDLRLEFYPNPTEVVSIGGFYKVFINPIEMYFTPGGGSGGTRSFVPANSPSAVSYGAELDIRKSFSGLTNSSFIDKFSFVANASLIKSRINLSDNSAETGLNNSRPMMGQSPYVINGGLYFQDDSLNLQVSLLYNRVGERIVLVGIPGVPEVYEMPRDLIDFTITKGITDHFSVRIGIKDILNQDNILLQDANEDNVLSKKDDQRMQFFNKGTVFTFGVKYAFKGK